MKKKKKFKLKKAFILIMIILLIIFLITVVFHKNDKNLKSIGYNNLEIEAINKLTKDEIDIIKKYSYNENLIYIIESENYDSNKLDLYLKTLNENKDVNYLNILNLINHKDFKQENLSDYLKLLKDYDNIDGIIKYINNYKDANLKIDSTLLSLIEQKYFIIDYAERYVNYYNKNKDLELDEIIRRVNSNLDYTFYKDVNKADLSKGMYTLVNKYNYLESNYVPEDLVTVDRKYTMNNTQLVKVAYENFVKMIEKAKEEGLTIRITTAYRSYNFQSTLYNNYVKLDGQKAADTYSARPGYSEHQLGYSSDVTNKNNVSFDQFENTKEYEWLQKNAYKFGFILRYPKDKEYITGYVFESWHYRYVGVDIATYIHENNLTYEEYYAYFLR